MAETLTGRRPKHRNESPSSRRVASGSAANYERRRRIRTITPRIASASTTTPAPIAAYIAKLGTPFADDVGFEVVEALVVVVLVSGVLVDADDAELVVEDESVPGVTAVLGTTTVAAIENEKLGVTSWPSFPLTYIVTS